MQTSIPNAVINHHSQELSADAKSVEFFTIKVHLAKDSPKPAKAPYLIFERTENIFENETKVGEINIAIPIVYIYIFNLLTLQQLYGRNTSEEETQSN